MQTILSHAAGHCPHCGQTKDVGSSRRKMAERLSVQLRLPRREQQVLACLARQDSGFVTTARLMDAVYGDDENGGPDNGESTLYVHVSKLRKKLLAHGYTIVSSRFAGYRLETVGENSHG